MQQDSSTVELIDTAHAESMSSGNLPTKTVTKGNQDGVIFEKVVEYKGV
jgi:hypothetical protein